MQSVVSNVAHHQPILDELVQESWKLTEKPAVASEVSGIEWRWNMVRIELERLTQVLETAVHWWTEYVQLVSHLHERLSDVSVKLQSDIRPNVCSVNSTLLASVLKTNQVTCYILVILFGLVLCSVVCCVLLLTAYDCEMG